MKLKSSYVIKSGQKVRLSHLPTTPEGTTEDKKVGQTELDQHRAQMAARQEVLYAEQKNAVLIVLQGMDTAGKDGTISHIFSGINPQGCNVASFKVPTPLEARHDFLWRAHNAVPPRGMIVIFNRSHYEDVLSPTVHGVITKKETRKRLEEINSFEEMLAGNDVTILKFFLHISREEQTRRLSERLQDPNKHWKLSESDFRERKFWDEYTRAYEDILEHTSYKHAPWFVIPSDFKWYRNLAISQLLVDAMKELKMKYPKPSFDPASVVLD
jgi:PPK2 family polyphosphate:nucleotide phosphotransferase